MAMCRHLSRILCIAAMLCMTATAWGQEETTAAATAEATTEATAEATSMADAAEEPAVPPPTIEDVMAKANGLQFVANAVWTMIAGFLVFFMNLGFGCVEAGMCRAKNCVNIISKNFVVFAAATLAFWFIGFGLMFGAGSPFVGQSGLIALSGTAETYTGISWANVPLECKFFFQLVFAGTAATIVSGAVAERIKYGPFIIFSFLITMFIYPVVGHWIWGGGWLATGKMTEASAVMFGLSNGATFWDFAGSTQVHSIGGWAALAGILVLGPRIGKYSAEGKVNAIPGHSLPMAFIGCMVLWLGWFGFNPGSTMTADAEAICHISMTTNLAAAAATITSTATAWIMLGKPDLGMTLNGCLAGLVAITAPCAWVTQMDAVIIGSIAGIIVVVSVIAFDRLKIDDPVGATSVHLVNGIFGTLCVGLFAWPEKVKELVPSMDPALAPANGLFHGGGVGQLMAQLIGVLSAGVYVFAVSMVFWLILKFTLGIRVSKEEELEGLDIGEHGNEAYPNFVTTGTAHG